MVTAFRWLAGITMALVLVQAALIGQSLYGGDPSRTTLHGWLGNVSFVGALLVAGLVFAAVRRGELGAPALGLGVLILLLMVAQIGLGYAGRGNAWATAVHIPNGVLIAGLLGALVALSLAPPAPAGRTRA